MTEGWFDREMYCVACGHTSLRPFGNNARADDFFCEVCGANFELKSGQGVLGKTIPDGTYSTMIERLKRHGGGPHLALLRYRLGSLSVSDLIMVLAPFLTTDVIIPRRALKPQAKRAGWVGCNIRLAEVPAAGRIPVIRDGEVLPRAPVLLAMRRATAVSGDLDQRSWLIDTLRCVERLAPEFGLSDIYAFDVELQARHTGNHHVRAKIRQQLQRLRDAGLVLFLGGARYRRVSP